MIARVMRAVVVALVASFTLAAVLLAMAAAWIAVFELSGGAA
ncbi:hypothetical protein [Micromonospora sp. WMMD980]|nr:hypothetical protein [Micromonospora sp. WMMD980]MDG4801702.1 hypothetical protein [Micromonospora sp. WMMD980]